MDSTTAYKWTFPEELYLDRKRGQYTFLPSNDTVPVLSPGDEVTLEELKMLFHPYNAKELSTPWEMFDDAVWRHIQSLMPPERVGVSPAPELQKEGGEEEIEPAPPKLPEATQPQGPPAVQVRNLKKQVKKVLTDLVSDPGGDDAILQGNFDKQIREVIVDLSKSVRPKHILSTATRGQSRSKVDRVMNNALASQAIGSHMALNEVELFSLAKTAILQSLSKTGYKSIVEVKQHLLLKEYSPSLGKKLCQHYREIQSFLTRKKVEPESIRLVDESKFIYLNEQATSLQERAIVLGITDAFVTLKETGRMTIQILDLLPAKLRKVLPPQMGPSIEAAEQLLQDSCYGQFRQAIDTSLSGGDHCDFFSIARGRRGILIFDVSGHEERASRLRDLLVQAIARLRQWSDPGRVLTLLNRFALKYPFPEDVFISMFYGVIDGETHKFVYANAGHHSPYIVRGGKIGQIEDSGGLALNIFETSYENREMRLVPQDCLVFYTDGLTEAVQSQTSTESGGREKAGMKNLFGKERLEEALAQRKISAKRTREAVPLILAAVREEGFVIEDDITIQIYRHI